MQPARLFGSAIVVNPPVSLMKSAMRDQSIPHELDGLDRLAIRTLRNHVARLRTLKLKVNALRPPVSGQSALFSRLRISGLQSSESRAHIRPFWLAVRGLLPF